MSYPTSHKTVFLMDHSLVLSSGVKLEMDNFCKPRGGNQSSNQQLHHIPLLPVTKTMWTCIVEAITEYCRIVWDIFPGLKLIRFLAADKTTHHLNSWNFDEQNLTHLMNSYIQLGPAKPGHKSDYFKSFQAAVEALVELTPIQQEKHEMAQENNTKVLNKGRVILITRVENDDEIKCMKDKFLEALLMVNKLTNISDKSLPINHCDLVLVNVCHSDYTPKPSIYNMSHDVASCLSFEATNIICGQHLAPKLCSLILKHYDLASTTVTGIPMKEEQNAKSSANYDVELFHPASAHAAILKGIPSETAHLKTIREGTDYETITLKWCTPRSNASTELQHCSSAYRITSVDVISRPSSCLTNFLLNGRWVMLEMPRKSGSKVISHMLASHSGDIYIHTMYTSRSVLEDPPSISEGCGGRVVDYRIPDFGELIKANLLSPYPEPDDDAPTPQDKSRERLKRFTKCWPMTLSGTSLFTIGSQIDPLINMVLKDTLNEDEVFECKKVIFLLMNLEAQAEPLPAQAAGQRGKSTKREEQYKSMWTELEQYLRSHLYSDDHKKVLECLLDCQNKSTDTPELKEEKGDLYDALKEFETYNALSEREKSEFNQGRSSSKHLLSDVTPMEQKRRRSNPPPLAPLGKNCGINLLTMWENKITSEQSRKCVEFAGRLKSENNVAVLYANLQQKEKLKDEIPRKNKPN